MNRTTRILAVLALAPFAIPSGAQNIAPLSGKGAVSLNVMMGARIGSDELVSGLNALGRTSEGRSLLAGSGLERLPHLLELHPAVLSAVEQRLPGTFGEFGARLETAVKAAPSPERTRELTELGGTLVKAAGEENAVAGAKVDEISTLLRAQFERDEINFYQMNEAARQLDVYARLHGQRERLSGFRAYVRAQGAIQLAKALSLGLVKAPAYGPPGLSTTYIPLTRPSLGQRAISLAAAPRDILRIGQLKREQAEQLDKQRAIHRSFAGAAEAANTLTFWQSVDETLWTRAGRNAPLEEKIDLIIEAFKKNIGFTYRTDPKPLPAREPLDPKLLKHMLSEGGMDDVIAAMVDGPKTAERAWLREKDAVADHNARGDSYFDQLRQWLRANQHRPFWKVGSY